MTCSRCHGLMREEVAGSPRRGWVRLWACFACGDRMDETIRLHRIFRREETMAERNERIWRAAQQAYTELTLVEVSA